MKKFIKVLVIIVIVLVVLAVGGFVTLLALSDWNLANLKYQNNDYTIEEDFSSVKIDVRSTDINILPSTDGKCKVVCFEDNLYTHSVKVEDGCLVIGCEFKTKVFFSYKESVVTLYLPQKVYNSLDIKATSGDVEIANMQAKECNINVTSGDIEVDKLVSDKLYSDGFSGDIDVSNTQVNSSIYIERHSGDIEVSSIKCFGNFDMATISGNMSLDNVVANNLTTKATSGEIELDVVLVSNELIIEATSGDVEFSKLDATNKINITTTSGDVSGTLLSDKIFAVKSSSGKTDIPMTTSGGVCMVSTTSGDIVIKIAQ